jgi:hypothetical protein
MLVHNNANWYEISYNAVYNSYCHAVYRDLLVLISFPPKTSTVEKRENQALRKTENYIRNTHRQGKRDQQDKIVVFRIQVKVSF